MTFHRSVFRELIRPFFLVFGVISFMLLMGKIQRLVNWMVDKHLDLDEVLLMFLYLLPATFSFTMPLGVLGASFMVVVRQSMDSEIIAVQALGASLTRYARPILVFGAVAAGASMLLTLFIQPYSNGKLLDLQIRMIKEHAEDSLIPGEFNFDFGNKVIRIQERTGDGKFKSIFLADRNLGAEAPVVMADRGNIEVDEEMKRVVFKLQDGAIYTPAQDYTKLFTTQFSSLSYVLTLPNAIQLDTEEVEADWSVPTWSLITLTARAKASNSPSYTTLAFELFNRISLPFISLAFAVAAVPLAVVDPRRGKSTGFLRAVLLLLTYYLLWVGFRDMILAGKAHPAVLFLPSLLILAIGGWMLWRKDSRAG